MSVGRSGRWAGIDFALIGRGTRTILTALYHVYAVPTRRGEYFARREWCGEFCQHAWQEAQPRSLIRKFPELGFLHENIKALPPFPMHQLS